MLDDGDGDDLGSPFAPVDAESDHDREDEDAD
jgi:hypothetical protein